MGSGWGSVGRAVASELEVSGSNPVIGKIFAECLLQLRRKDEKKKSPGMAYFFKRQALAPI